MLWIYKYQSPLGAVTMAARGNALIGLWFDGQKYFGATLTEDCEEKQLPVFHEAERWLNTYFKGVLPDFMPPIETGGTNFQREVWDKRLVCAVLQLKLTPLPISSPMPFWMPIGQV